VSKVAVCGKGGSGKSTVVALLADEIRRRGRRILVVDSDESNSGLYRMLGFPRAPRPLMELAGGKRHVQRLMRAGFSSGVSEPALSVLQQERISLDQIPEEYVLRREGLAMVAVGKIHQALEGCACPMGVLSREFLKRLELAEQEFALVDMEAGVEHFGRGVETSVDAVMAVVEPSLESISLAARIQELATGAKARFAGVILNKVPNRALLERLHRHLQNQDLPTLGVIRYRRELVEAGLSGGQVATTGPLDEVAGLVDTLFSGTLDVGSRGVHAKGGE